MKLFLCESVGHRVVVAAPDGDRAREICAAAEIENLGLGRRLGEEAAAANLGEFVLGWRATELLADADEGIQLAWWGG